MSISSIFTQPASSLASIAASQIPLTTSTPQTSSDGDSANISQMGQLIGELQQLATSNPSEFQQVTSKIATALQQAGEQQGGSAGSFLTNLASKFQTASQTGSLAPLESMGHHGGHHHGGGGGLTSLLSSASTPSSSASASTGVSAYSNSSNQSMLSQVMNIIGQALSSQGVSAWSQPSATS